jgi:hypothetical protein
MAGKQGNGRAAPGRGIEQAQEIRTTHSRNRSGRAA